MKKVLLFLADGFEECEGLIVVDILRRAGISVTTASIMGREQVVSSHQIKIAADVLAEQVDPAQFDAVVLPGGIPGTPNLKACPLVTDTCRSFFKSGKLVAAICAAPVFSVHWVCCRENGRRYIPAWRIRWPERSMPLVRWWWTAT